MKEDGPSVQNVTTVYPAQPASTTQSKASLPASLNQSAGHSQKAEGSPTPQPAIAPQSLSKETPAAQTAPPVTQQQQPAPQQQGVPNPDA
jgi:hypothetical protein